MTPQMWTFLGFWSVVLVTADREGGATGGECPIRGEGRSLYHSLHARAEDCVTALYTSLNSELEQASNSTQVQQAYRSYCGQRPALRQCLASLKPAAALCLNAVLRARFDLLCGYKELWAEAGCASEGERLAVIYEGRGSASPVDSCRNTADSRVWLGTQRDPNLDMVLEFFMLRKSIECLEKHRGGELDTLVDAGLLLWTEILDEMKCEDQGNSVSCKEIMTTAAAP